MLPCGTLAAFRMALEAGRRKLRPSLVDSLSPNVESTWSGHADFSLGSQ